MKEQRFICPFALCYFSILTLGSYVALWTKSDLSTLSLRYGRIFFHGEVLCESYLWLSDLEAAFVFALDWLSNLVHVNLSGNLVYFGSILDGSVVHLRTAESHPVMLTESIYAIDCPCSLESNPFCNFLVSVVFAIVGFWICLVPSLHF